MKKRKNIDKSKYDWKPIHYVKDVPWPRIEQSNHQDIKIPLKESYLLRSMDYLDTKQAKIIFQTQAEIIKKLSAKGIVDVGCRIGMVNEILHDSGYTDYNYMGFDTSPQPISYARERWSEFKNIEYRLANCENKRELHVDFKVDCVIWSGILLYYPNDHMKLFHSITVDLYNSKYAIIQEPCKNQKYWQSGLILHTIEDDLPVYRKNYRSYKEEIVEAKIFSGRRKIVTITL